MIVIEASPNAGYFRLDGIDYPKGHYCLKYDNVEAVPAERNFSLCNIYDGKKLISSRGYSEIEGVSDWTELMRHLNVIGVLQNNDVSGSADSVPMYQFMDLIGDGLGATNQNVDGSVTPVSFFVKPPAGKIYGIARIIFSLRDGGIMDSGGWGNSGSNPLNNGIVLNWRRAGSVISLTREAIKSHIDVAAVCHDLQHRNWGQGDGFITARFTFTKAGNYLMLDGNLGDYLEVVIRDDLTYLVQQRVSAQGYQK